MISLELVSLILILVPGLISFIIIENLTTQHKIEYKKSIVYVILLNFISFAILFLLCWMLHHDCFDYLKNYDEDLNLSKIVLSYNFSLFFILWIILSIIIGFIIAILINKNIIYKIANYLGATIKVSNLPVWDDILSTPRESNFIVIRDMKNKLIYCGNLAHYSMLSATEIHLVNVDIYNEEAIFLYDVEEIYLPFMEHMTIEFPKYEIENKENKNEKQK